MTGDTANRAQSIRFLQDVGPDVPAAEATATLAQEARAESESQVVSRTSMFRLLFTNLPQMVVTTNRGF